MSTYWTDGTALYHYGIPGQRWGQRRFQNEDGTLTEAGRRRYAKLDRYRNKLVDRTKRRSTIAKNDAKEARQHYENVKKYGKASDEYAQYVKSKMKDTSDWVEDDNKRAENAYSNLRTYNKYYGPFDISGIQKQTVSELMTKYRNDETNYRESSKSWMKANQALLDMNIDAITTNRSDIRRVMRINK